jgi:hypothetical protein
MVFVDTDVGADCSSPEDSYYDLLKELVVAVEEEEEAVGVGAVGFAAAAAAAAAGSDNCRFHRNVDLVVEFGNYTDSDADSDSDAGPAACQNIVG